MPYSAQRAEVRERLPIVVIHHCYQVAQSIMAASTNEERCPVGPIGMCATVHEVAWGLSANPVMETSRTKLHGWRNRLNLCPEQFFDIRGCGAYCRSK